MSHTTDLLLTASAPAIWGSTYIVTTEMLPAGYPLTIAMLRALPAGLILLMFVRQLPGPGWRLRVFMLGALNFSIFWAALFVAAYRLPGGVASTLGAMQPLMVLILARFALGTPIRAAGIISTVAGIGGIALLILGPKATYDAVGIAAALIGAASMAAGTVLTRKWQPPVSPLTFTAWQLTAGGLLLLPVALLLEPKFPVPTGINIAGLIWLGLIGAALTYFFWFRGIARFGPATVTAFGFLSPVSAVILGWLIMGQQLTPAQMAGALIVLASVWLGSKSGRQATQLATDKIETAPLQRSASGTSAHIPCTARDADAHV